MVQASNAAHGQAREFDRVLGLAGELQGWQYRIEGATWAVLAFSVTSAPVSLALGSSAAVAFVALLAVQAQLIRRVEALLARARTLQARPALRLVKR